MTTLKLLTAGFSFGISINYNASFFANYTTSHVQKRVSVKLESNYTSSPSSLTSRDCSIIVGNIYSIFASLF